MKRISVYAFAFVAATQLLTLSASAQDKKEKREKEEKREHIIIRKKGDKTEKTTIVIEGDKVTINGKPVEKGDKDVIIQRFNDEEFVFRSPKIRMTAPRGAYRFNHDGNWEQFNSDNFRKEFRMNWNTGAFLGVVTEDHDKGAVVEEVQKETPAEKAGLQKGDIITKVGDKKIGSPSDLSEAVHAKKPNDEVDITYLRDGKEKKTKVKLGESKGPHGMQNFDFHIPDMPGFGEGQFNFEHLQPRLHGLQDQIRVYQGGRPKFGATIQDTEEGNGVKVLEVDADSPSAKSGLQKDDVITEVDGKAVKNVAEARTALRGNNEKNLWTVKVLRAGKPVTVEVKIPKKLNKADL